MMNSEERHASLLSRRRLLINGAIATAGWGLIGDAGALVDAAAPIRRDLRHGDRSPLAGVITQRSVEVNL
jgi:hypothetical protein